MHSGRCSEETPSEALVSWQGFSVSDVQSTVGSRNRQSTLKRWNLDRREDCELFGYVTGLQTTRTWLARLRRCDDNPGNDEQKRNIPKLPQQVFSNLGAVHSSFAAQPYHAGTSSACSLAHLID